MKNKNQNIWKPHTEINWSADDFIKLFSVDTRDFHVCCTNAKDLVGIIKDIRCELTKIEEGIYKELRKNSDTYKLPTEITKKADIRKYLHPMINEILTDQYFFNATEIKSLIDTWFKHSGGSGTWRMFTFNNNPNEVTGWDWKYIRIYQIPEYGFLVGPGTKHKRSIFKKKVDILSFTINQDILHTH